ncbi:MAG: hypothetical protein IAF02_13755 [Anaerolineae bacterium]|nr:hypothetical protein [Anaerolineae bacterium]
MTKLILVEGLPGSGKTTTAVFVADWLTRQGVETAVFLEGNLNHPADFESVACLDAPELTALKTQFPEYIDFLDRQVLVDGDDHFFRYRALQQTIPTLPEALIAALARYEIYELPADKFRRILLRRWQRFADSAAASTVTYIFECTFLQNPLTMMLGRHDESVTAAQAFVLELAASVQPLQPRWLYLDPGNVRDCLTQAAQTRPPEWLDYVIAYHTRQGHGKAQGWQGFDGMVNFYEMRHAIELGLLPQLPFSGLLVQHTTWLEDQKKIAEFLDQTFSSQIP